MGVVRQLSRGVASSVLEAAIVCAGRHQNSLRILYYHRVDREVNHVSCVAPERFERHMDYLWKEGYRVLSLDSVCEHLMRNISFPERSVVLTFDDGFKDNFTYAYPILAQHGFPAIIFLAAGYIGGKELPVFTRYEGSAEPLSWDEVKEMHRSGVAFGAHSLTHANLIQLDDGNLEREIVGSKTLIEEKLGQEVKFFCYPRGKFNRRVKSITAGAGYTGACATTPGPVRSTSDSFALPRTYIGRDDTVAEFRKKLHGAYDVLHRAKQTWVMTASR